ncbi:predicted protein [Nematostella vectensis]|uniref:Sorbitol dehydrogenase n=2 Tax=Nematostella vectensis TaxID=45351 RepID=A7SU04_NEMVE|nr:predicted protein [Nematostella vectensis]|eukprot:XP_001624910.1 predicted protein [Nematostella vectensis]
MHTVGICGSDVHYWKHGCIGDFVLTAPMVLGHESSGVICAVGEGVSDLKEGDRVAIEPGTPCRTCSYCKKGRYNLCAKMNFCATPPYHGSLCRRYNHQADFCYKLPDHVSLEEGALLEPLSVGVHACNRAGITIGSNVLVCGAGPIGLVTLLTAKACGASKVAITDLDEGRLKKARELGADYTIKVESRDGRDMARKVQELLGPADQTVECTGAESSIHTGIYATKSGGVLVIVGMGKSKITLPIVDALCREVDIRGIFRYVNCYPTALAMVASGRVNVKPLITHHFKLEESLQAFETSRTGAGGAIKVLIHCNKE